MKKIIALVLVVSICLCMAGCDLYKGKKRIVGVTYQNEIFNAVQNQECMSGIKLMQNELRVAYYENENPEEFESNLRIIVKEGHEFIWCFEPESKDALEKIAPESPNTKFGLFDATYDGKIPENVTTVTFREHEGAFLAGYIAGRTTVNNILGFLGGKENDISRKFEYGYKAGILYAAKELGKQIDVVTLYTGDDHSKESGKSGAKKLYLESGCDIIFQATQVTGLGAIEAAVELNKLIIGNGIDQSSYGPKNVLTSVIKNAKNAVNRVTTMFTEDKDMGGKNFEYGLKDRVIGIAKTNTNMDKNVYRDAMALRDKILDDSLEIPYNEETYLLYSQQ